MLTKERKKMGQCGFCSGGGCLFSSVGGGWWCRCVFVFVDLNKKKQNVVGV
jgi:hypothetical protein